MTLAMEIPFIYGRIAEAEEFTGREKDTKRLRTNLTGGVNTVIMSPRRWGKSSLVHHTLEEITNSDKDFITCHVDMFNCKDEEAFFRTYANAIVTASATKVEEAIETVKKYIGSFGPKITLGDAASTMEFSLGIDFKDKKYSTDEILDLPERIAQERGKRFIVCIDEFQNVENFSDSRAFQAQLRSHWQRHQRVTYCLYGSKRHMLMNIFADYEMPFYKFGDIMLLQKIESEIWKDFIVKRFNDTGKRIAPELAMQIAEKVECHSYYVQQYSQLVWLLTDESATAEVLDEAYEQMLDRSALLFETIIDGLKPRHISFLTAIANDEQNVTSARVLSKYNLGTSANVKNLKAAVLDKDLVMVGKNGKDLEIQDPLMKTWLRRRYRD